MKISHSQSDIDGILEIKACKAAATPTPASIGLYPSANRVSF